MAKQELTAKVGNCSISLGLDKRKMYNDGYNVAIKFVIAGSTVYHQTGSRATVCDYERIINTSSTRGRRSADKASDANTLEEWSNIFNDYKARLQELDRNTPLSLNAIRVMLTGRSDTVNFLSVWREVIASRAHGTAASYEVAMKSFMRLSGYRDGDGFNVTKDTVHKWVQGLTDEGKAKATIGIYLRGCRVVVNECISRGLMTKKNYPFGAKDDSLVTIPRGRSRKQDCLSVEQMTTLFRLFREKDYPEEWGEQYIKDTHTYLGMFLFMYLGNGMNLADLARLTYNEFYFRSNKKALMFNRQKTRERTDDESEVIVPITNELRYIMREIATSEEREERLFPMILKDSVTEKDCARRIQQENQNIKKHVRKLAEVLGWQEQPSPTWCRHSFATNLIQAGVPQKYVSDAMGHSTGGNVTMGYVGEYPLEKQMEYNGRLLNFVDKPNDLLVMIDRLSNEERETLLAKLMGK